MNLPSHIQIYRKAAEIAKWRKGWKIIQQALYPRQDNENHRWH